MVPRRPANRKRSTTTMFHSATRKPGQFLEHYIQLQAIACGTCVGLECTKDGGVRRNSPLRERWSCKGDPRHCCLPWWLRVALGQQHVLTRAKDDDPRPSIVFAVYLGRDGILGGGVMIQYNPDNLENKQHKISCEGTFDATL